MEDQGMGCCGLICVSMAIETSVVGVVVAVCCETACVQSWERVWIMLLNRALV